MPRPCSKSAKLRKIFPKRRHEPPTLTDEQLRALRFLARHPRGCTEATLLEQGFTAAQLGYLVYAGLASYEEKAS
jgi:hypothetical protein